MNIPGVGDPRLPLQPGLLPGHGGGEVADEREPAPDPQPAQAQPHRHQGGYILRHHQDG